MKNSLETRLGYFVVLAMFAGWIITETLGGVESFHGGYRLNALFDTVQDLKIGNSVKMAGVEIGRVEKIVLTGNRVQVTMKLHSDVVVKTDSKAVIKFTGLMGQNFVAISFGTPEAPRAVDGAVLATEEQPDLNAIMTKLDGATTGIQNLTKSFTPDTINNLMGHWLISSNKTAATSAERSPTLRIFPARSRAGRARSANSFMKIRFILPRSRR